MKRKYNIYKIVLAAVCALGVISCTKDQTASGGGASSQGTQLKIAVGVGELTRLSELPGTADMADSINTFGLYNIGLYIYYTSDYDRGDLSQPYIRNMECTIDDGYLVPVLSEGENPDNGMIYIYDRMTIVAFYPYNAEMSLKENYFKVLLDEEKYPITRADYSQQKYIPYRASTTTNPTTAFYTQLDFFPKHTYKIEIALVADDEGAFPDESDLMILPAIDPVTNTDLTLDNKRAAWIDNRLAESNGGGGSHIRQYTAYIWTENKDDNNIERGSVLMQAGDFTLIASQDLTTTEQRVYRYGYNLTTGEIFIPTSSFLIHDRPTLAKLDGKEMYGYQVCDIDLGEGGDWKPISLLGGRFDGGGHRIENMTINTSSSQAGLFSYVQGNTIISNVNIIDPVIEVNNPSDTVYVGAVCGKLNNPLSEEDRRKLLASLPDELSQVVKDALIKDLLANALNSQTSMVACRVENPKIIVNGLAPRVGSLCGAAGDKNEEGSFRARIWDSYALGGTITVNQGNESQNTDGYTGGFCGLNNGIINWSYTTTADITFNKPTTVDGQTVLVPAYEGFTTLGNYFTSSSDIGLTDNYASLPDSNTQVSSLENSWPSWSPYTGYWPFLNTGWESSPSTNYWYNMGMSPDIYPILQYERR